MKYYLLENRSMPWGDYGAMLFSGLLKVLDEHYDDLEIPEIERTGPYFPDIYMANTSNIIVTDRVKTLLESSDISGITGYRRAIVKKMVDINWQSWDLDSEDPLFYPKGNSPINYIRQGANSEDLMRSAPQAWELLVGRDGEIKKLSDTRDYLDFSNLVLASSPSIDIFQPKNMLFIVVSERFKAFIEREKISTLSFVELSIES